MSSGTCAVADKYTPEEILCAAQVSGSAMRSLGTATAEPDDQLPDPDEVQPLIAGRSGTHSDSSNIRRRH
ncbi:hypothetical protein ACPPVO_43520 [Dactylosporangium sp. McL0621]|uniref:hypothetical protein n=1 Tax=Dactylosporangium sp. McL0621 TaxID=3415678 RepID=UPI003CE839C3